MKILMKLMNRILPSCEEVSHLTSQAMDGKLSWSKRMGLRMHLRVCIWCRRNAEQLELMRNLAQMQAHKQHEKARLNSDARKRIAQALEKNAKQS